MKERRQHQVCPLRETKRCISKQCLLISTLYTLFVRFLPLMELPLGDLQINNLNLNLIPKSESEIRIRNLNPKYMGLGWRRSRVEGEYPRKGDRGECPRRLGDEGFLTAMPRALRMFILHMGQVRWSNSQGSTQLLWNTCLEHKNIV